MLATTMMPVGMAAAETPAETAAAFGAREGVEQLSLSPNGENIAFVAASAGQSGTLYTVALTAGAVPRKVLVASGAPERLGGCRWVTDARLVCTIAGVTVTPDEGPINFARIVAIDADGTNPKLLSVRQQQFSPGQVIDWLPDENGNVLMTRYYSSGGSVERIDTKTGKASIVEAVRPNAVEYISDGHGKVRVAGYARSRTQTFMDSGIYAYRYRPAGSNDWRDLGDYNSVKREGFNPYAVDATTNLVYGVRRVDGRAAIVARTLDGSEVEKLIYSRPDVDVTRLETLGPYNRVVGVSFATDTRQTVYFDPTVKALTESLRRALPKLPSVQIVDTTRDESKMLIFAGSDNDPGRYYLFDRKTKQLKNLMLVRPQLEKTTLATMTPITYRATDGTSIPAYLTLPPGGARRGLPAIVMPHGGPSARDEWGYDWLSQYFAARGYAVIQPNFRGSTGYGDSFLNGNAFKAWRTAIGDVTDAGRWLVSEGIADPKKLAIFGWSYGGYAALQSSVVEPNLFKAVVAVAPVTDLALLKEQTRNWSNFRLTANFIGGGPEMEAGSPAQQAVRIVAPVLLIHGTVDTNVDYKQSTVMAGKLRGAGKSVELMTFEGLDHQLEDSAARAKMLERADGFIRAAIGG